MHADQMRLSTKRKMAICLVVALLIVSAVANVILLRVVQETFFKLQFARIFPLGDAIDGDLEVSRANKDLVIAFWGDSRAYMWNKSTLGSGITIHDHAHGGFTSTQLLLQLKTQSQIECDLAVVQIGINDLHPLGVFAGEKARILAQLKSNLTMIRDALLLRSQIVVLTTLFPPDRVPLSRRHAWDPETLSYIHEINEVIRQFADGRRVLVLDAHALLKESDQYLAAKYTDNDYFLHVNENAYLRLNDELRKVILGFDSHASMRSAASSPGSAFQLYAN